MKKSQKALLASGKILFWKHGISRISVEELCAHAELSKMTFYRYYENKYHLAKEILQREIESGTEHYERIMHSNRSFHERFSELMLYKVAQTKMISMELVQDLFIESEESVFLRDYLQEQQRLNIEKIRTDLSQAQKQGELRSDLSINFLMHMLITFAQQMQNPRLLEGYSSPVDLVQDFSQLFLHGILEKSAT